MQYLRQRFAFERPVLLEQCLSWRAGGDKFQDMSQWEECDGEPEQVARKPRKVLSVFTLTEMGNHWWTLRREM